MTVSDGIDWVGADRSNREALKSFACAEPPKKLWDAHAHVELPHPQPWALRVQSDIRTKRPPVAPDEALLLGMKDGQLASVSHYAWVNDPYEAPQLVILTLARDNKFKAQGVGDATLKMTLQILRETRDMEHFSCGVFTRIDRRNEASQKLFARAGFWLLDDYEDESKLQYWVHDLL